MRKPSLTAEQVAEIKASAESGVALAARYGVSKMRISEIRRGEACLVEKRERNRRWYADPANAEKERERNRAIARERDAANPDRHRACVAAFTARRRAAKFGVPAGRGKAIVDFYYLAATARMLPCEYCGIDPGPGLREVDHKTPFARGGPHGIENLAVSCKACNSGKSTMTSEEFLLAEAA